METTDSVELLQIKINELTSKLVTTQRNLDQTRQILKSIEDENKTLKATLENVINSKKENPIRKVMSDIVEIIGNMKFQSPIIRRES